MELPQTTLTPSVHPLKDTGHETSVEQLDEAAEQSHRQSESPQSEDTESIGNLQQTAQVMDDDRDQPWIDDGNDSENGELAIPSEEEYYDYDYEPPAQFTTRPHEANMPQSQSTMQHPWEKHSVDELDQTRKGEYVEEKKSTEEVLQMGRDQIGVNELLRDQHRNTYLTQMAADSTLIADYEEAIKHVSKKISYDEEDESYISGEGNSSALPRHLPPEFEQALAKENQPRAIQQLKVETQPAADHEVAQETASDDDIADDEEAVSPTTSFPQSDRRHPRLPPSPRDNESYRMGYFGDSADASLRGQRRKSPEKPIVSVSLLVESAPPLRESLFERGERMQNTAPLRYHDHRAYEQDEYALETSYESQLPSSNARSPHAAPGYLSGSEYSDSAGYSSPDVSTDRTSAYPGSSIDEIDEGQFGGSHPSHYSDPTTLARNQVGGDSGLVFRNPDTFGAAGVGSGVVSPSVRRRGTAREYWRGGHDMTESRAQDDFSSAKSKSSASQILKFWTSGAASEEEQEEAQSFQDTAQWVDRDPDVGGFRDDDDVSPPVSPEPRVLEKNLNIVQSRGMPDVGSVKGWRQAPSSLGTQVGTMNRTPEHESRNNMTPSSRAWVGPNTSFTTSASDMKSSKSRSKSKKKRVKDVFDPFADSDDVQIDDASALFSPLPDPYMTEESFSPPVWDTPRGRTTQPYASADWSQTQAEI
jgi:hypothetical protein